MASRIITLNELMMQRSAHKVCHCCGKRPIARYFISLRHPNLCVELCQICTLCSILPIQDLYQELSIDETYVFKIMIS